MATEATELRAGDVIKHGGALHKVQSSNLHAGGGKAGSMVHAKLRHLGTGHLSEQRFAPNDKLDKVDIDRVNMEYLYNEGEDMVFMHPTSFEQCRLPKKAAGEAGIFLKEGTTLIVELMEEKPIALHLPDSIEIAVKSTGSGVSTGLKEAELENGVTLKVPHFIKDGDRIHVSMETLEYMDRVHEKVEKAVFKGSPKKGGGKEAPKAAPGAPAPAAPAAPPAADKKEKK